MSLAALSHLYPNQTLTRQIELAFLEASKTCSTPWILDAANDLPGVPINLHQLFTILAAVACIINTLFALFLLWGHLFHWTKPREQKQIVRILMFIPVASICAFFAIWFYGASGFIVPIGEFYEGFAITALFLLYVQLITPDESKRDVFFHRLERRVLNGKKKGNNGSLRWFRVCWAMVLQVSIFRILTVIASEVLYNELCPLSPWRQYGNIIISTVQGTSTGIAVTGVIIFEHRVREQLAEHQTLFKLISFKVVVALEAFQNFVFPILADKGFFLPSAPFFVSFNDFSEGLPSFIFIWELTIVSIVFLYSFGFERYRSSALSGAPVLASPGSAFLSSFSTVDIWRGVAYSFKLFSTKPIEYQDSPSKLESNESDDSQGSAFKVQYSATESHNMHQSRY